MVVKAIKCNKCKDIIYSRYKHDFRWCSCESVAIDGGFDYLKATGNIQDIKLLNLNIKNCDKQILMQDYNKKLNKFGKIDEISFNNLLKNEVIVILDKHEKINNNYECGWLI